MENKQFIAFTGHKKHGKDTSADYLVKTRNFQKLSLATPLKSACAAIFHFSTQQLYDEKLKEEIDLRWGFSPRECLQKMGTEVLRDGISKYLPIGIGEIWLKSFTIHVQQILKENPKAKIVVSDCRFPNEAEFLTAHGFYIVKIENDLLKECKDKHVSETSIGIIIIN